MDVAARFGSLSALGKARLIAAVCAVCGVLMGFVIYIVFAHNFEQGEVTTRLIALAVGLTVAMGVARLGEWLWDTIATGQAELGGQGKKAFTTAIFLVVIFELCASTVEDFAKMALSDANSVRVIAAKIAGERQRDFTLNEAQIDFPGLLKRLREEARANGVQDRNGPPAATPEGRMIQMMGPQTRWILFAADAKPDADNLSKLMLATSRASVWSMWGRTVVSFQIPAGCQDRGLGGLGVQGSAADLAVRDPEAFARLSAQREQDRAARADACLAALHALPDGERLKALRPALQEIVTNRALYAPASFPAARDSPLAAALEPQAALCAKIFAGRPPEMKALAIQDSCVRVAEQAPELAAANPGLLPPWQIAALNYKLLHGAMPDQLRPLPVYWSDFALLVFVWCAAAMALGVFLVNGVFTIASGGMVARFAPALAAAVKALLAAAIALGLSVLAVRLAAYAWLLMFGDIPTRPDLPGILNIVNVVPWAVQSLREIDLWGVSIPGWVTLPVVTLVLGMIAKGVFDDGDNTEAWWAFAALFGIVALAAFPVLPGILGLMTIVAVSWVVPAFGLAVLLPYLEPGARVPRYWGVIALGAGILLGIWAFLRLGQADALSEALMFATAMFLIVTGALITRNVAVRDLWPLLTVTVAFCLVGGTSLWQDATFKSILGALHETTQSAASAWTFQNFWFGSPESGLPLVANPGEVDEAARLELALVGSLGFWLTIAMLAAWSLRRKDEGLDPFTDPGKAISHA
jgi:hypothetical protein